jgi:multisubunit Na+/H+ antiporter MnhE subunit
MRAWVTWWIVLAAFYLLLVDNTTTPELVAGAVAAAAGATGAVIVRRQRLYLLHPRPQHFRGTWRPFLRIFPDVLVLARALVTRRRGDLHEEPFEDAEDPTARAFAEGFGSLAPNTIVVDIDDGKLITHRL